MVDVFISYKSDRRKAAAHLTRILECYGYTVWYDYSLIKGRDFAAQIDAKIRESKAVIVLWCSKSVRSEWVAAEAALAAKLDTLVPAKIEPCELRVDFRQKDYIDLTGWGGAARDHALDLLLTALEQKTGHAPQLNFKAMCEYEEVWRRFGAPSLKAFALDAAVRSDPESSEEAKAPGEARHDREASARQPKREWADDIQMPIPDRGPVSLVPDQAQPRAESDPPPSPRPFSPASLLPDESPVERTRKLIYKYFIGFFLALPLIALDLLGNETGLALFESRFEKKPLII
jgi:hypothetical protein